MAASDRLRSSVHPDKLVSYRKSDVRGLRVCRIMADLAVGMVQSVAAEMAGPAAE